VKFLTEKEFCEKFSLEDSGRRNFKRYFNKKAKMPKYSFQYEFFFLRISCPSREKEKLSNDENFEGRTFCFEFSRKRKSYQKS